MKTTPYDAFNEDDHALLPGGKVILRKGAGDTMIHDAVGWSRYVLSADLGQANDPTAISIIHDECLPYWKNSLSSKLGPRTRTVVYLDHFVGETYPAIVNHIIGLMTKPALAGRTQLVIDGSGLGRVVSDIFDDEKVRHTAIQMVAGQKWVRDGKYANVGKTLLLETLQVLMQMRAIEFAADLTEIERLRDELSSFETKVTASNNVVIRGGDSQHHGDLAISVALGAFATENLTQGVIGSIQLAGMY